MGDVELIGDEEVEVVATLNGKPLKRRAKARQHLADFLRQELELTGTHLGCEHGICGACTVLIDGRTARGCLTLTAQISGKSVETIEGLSDNGRLAELQQEFIARNAAQCGFCSSGMLLTAYELVQCGEKLSRSEIREHISGNMCRCTGYHAIVDAIEAVLAKGSR
jgi:aerobic-type carbon monoxide dehydrogenase small subunit (CoxS/CutS family)